MMMFCKICNKNEPQKKSHVCRECKNAIARSKYDPVKEKERTARRDPVKKREAQKRFALKHRDSINAKARSRYDPVKEKERTARRDPGRQREAKQGWHSRNPDHPRQYYLRNRDVRLATEREQSKTLHDEYIKTIIYMKTGISRILITKEMIEMQREVLNAKRILALYRKETGNAQESYGIKSNGVWESRRHG